MDLWFTSDTHFCHQNIIAYSERPWKWAREMDEALIEGWNTRVKPQDHVYHLGDVTMLRGVAAKQAENILRRLQGHKRLVLGNHDVQPMAWYLQWFEKVMALRVYDRMLFTHIPVHPASLGRFSANVHGHIHSNPDYPPHMRINKETQEVTWVPYINICVEVTNYHPINLDELRARVSGASSLDPGPIIPARNDY